MIDGFNGNSKKDFIANKNARFRIIRVKKLKKSTLRLRKWISDLPSVDFHWNLDSNLDYSAVQSSKCNSEG